MLWLLSQLTTAIGTVFMLALTFSPSIYNPQLLYSGVFFHCSFLL